jgi:hypothetical protein
MGRVLELPLIAGPGNPAVRSFATCLASVLQTPAEDVPVPDGTIREAVQQWRQWLAGRGLGLVGVAAPQAFNLPGFWVAVVTIEGSESPTAVLMFGTPAGAVLSPAAPDLVGRALTELDVIEGYVVAQLDPALLDRPMADQQQGVVEALAIAAAATAPMQVVASARAIAGRGLAGDRYAAQAGTFSSHSPSAKGYDLTLIEAEVLEDLVLPDGQRLSFPGARRNILTRGVGLNGLVGRRFLIGDVECLGQRLCEPCVHLQRLSGPGLLKPLIHRGGLRADILTDGEISVGATVQASPFPA